MLSLTTRRRNAMAAHVFLLRHAESARPDVFHGAESDIGLSERGRRQAEAVAPILAAEKPDAVICSAMRRARDTAGPIAAACGLTPILEPELHERRVGDLAGRPFGGKDGVWPATLRRWMAGETGFTPEDAESFDDIRNRVLPVWNRLTHEWSGRRIIIVAHGVVCKVLLLSNLQGYGVTDWDRLGSIQNVGITEVVQDGVAWRALRISEMARAVETV
jgi:probable phosphoglycerate mutase